MAEQHPNPEGSASEPAGLPSTFAEELRGFVTAAPQYDPVNRPRHYNSHPSGIEAIQITEHMSFCLGNALKYIWRADLKGGVEDLRKAAWYIEREIKRRELAGAARIALTTKANSEWWTAGESMKLDANQHTPHCIFY